MVTNAELPRSGLSSGGSPALADPVPTESSSSQANRAARFVGGVTGWHGPALLLLLFMIFPLVAAESVWSADIGARLYQAKTLLDSGHWTAIHPLPRVDPDGLYFPIHLSAATDAAFHFIPYPKHPLLVWITAAEYQLALRLPGDTDSNIVAAVVAVNTLATFATAVGTARLVARSRPRLAVPAMWFTGLISPLFVDAYVGHAHSLAAAMIVWALGLLLQFTEPLPPRAAVDFTRLVGAGVLLSLACQVRTESSLLGIAIAAGLVVAGWHRPTRSRWLFAALMVALSTGASTVADRLMTPATSGPANPLHGGEPWGGLVGRVEGIQRTLLSPGGNQADLLILAAALLVIIAGYLVGRGSDRSYPEILLAVASVAAVVRVVQGDMVLIFGLFLACPLLLVGIIRLGRGALQGAENRFHLTTIVLFAGAVVATQYRYGGGAEWGGRYFAIGLPSAIVLAVQGLDSALESLSGPRVRRLVVLAITPAIALNLAGLYGIRESRARTAAMVDVVAEEMATLRLRTASATDQSALAEPDATEPADPIVITTVPAAGRLSWAQIDNGRWLLVDEGELDTVAERLSEFEVRHWILLTTEPTQELAEVEAFYRAEPWESSDDVPADVIVVTTVDS